MTLNVRHMDLDEETWLSRYVELRDTTIPGIPIIRWPLPQNRVYEVVQLGITWFVLRRGEHFKSLIVGELEVPKKPWYPFGIDQAAKEKWLTEHGREGEGSVCVKCGGAYTTAQCPAYSGGNRISCWS